MTESDGGIFCKTCEKNTEGENPIEFRTQDDGRIYFSIRCTICKKRKNKRLTTREFDLLPPEIQGAATEERFSNIITRNGKLISLMDLISPVLTGKKDPKKNFIEEDKISDAIKQLYMHGYIVAFA